MTRTETIIATYLAGQEVTDEEGERHTITDEQAAELATVLAKALRAR